MNNEDVTFLIKTHERPDVCRRLIGSVKKKYPGSPIHVADDSKSPGRYEGTLTIAPGFDTGLSFGRNMLLDTVRTPYFCSLDDDFVLTPRSDVAKMLRVLERGYELCFGTINDRSNPKWAGNLVEGDGVLRLVKNVTWKSECGDVWIECDMAPNFFVGRRGTKHRYDPRWKIGAEHISSSIDLMRAGLKCAFVPSSSVSHQRNGSKLYRNRRGRANAFLDQWKRENGIRNITTHHDIMINAPNIVILTPGSTGSRVIVQLYELQGYACPGKDEFGESPAFREINSQVIRGKSPSIAEFVSDLPKRWVLKDPRLTAHPRVFRYWAKFFRQNNVMLILNMRDASEHSKSARQRWGMTPRQCLERRNLAIKIFDEWEGLKNRINYEQLRLMGNIWKEGGVT